MRISDNSEQPSASLNCTTEGSSNKWNEFLLDVTEYLLLLDSVEQVTDMLNETIENHANYSMEEIRVICQMAERRCVQLAEVETTL